MYRYRDFITPFLAIVIIVTGGGFLVGALPKDLLSFEISVSKSIAEASEPIEQFCPASFATTSLELQGRDDELGYSVSTVATDEQSRYAYTAAKGAGSTLSRISKYDLVSGMFVSSFNLPSTVDSTFQPLNAVTIITDGKMWIPSSAMGIMRYDTTTNDIQIISHADAKNIVALKKSSDRVYGYQKPTSGRGGKLVVFNRASGEVITSLRLPDMLPVLNGLEVSNDGQKIVMSIGEGIFVYERGAGTSYSLSRTVTKNQLNLNNVAASIGGVSLNKTNNLIYATAFDQEMIAGKQIKVYYIFELDMNGTLLRTKTLQNPDGLREPNRGIAVSPNGRTIILSDGAILNSRNFFEVTRLIVPKTSSSYINYLQFSENGAMALWYKSMFNEALDGVIAKGFGEQESLGFLINNAAIPATGFKLLNGDTNKISLCSGDIPPSGETYHYALLASRSDTPSQVGSFTIPIDIRELVGGLRRAGDMDATGKAIFDYAVNIPDQKVYMTFVIYRGNPNITLNEPERIVNVFNSAVPVYIFGNR